MLHTLFIITAIVTVMQTIPIGTTEADATLPEACILGEDHPVTLSKPYTAIVTVMQITLKRIQLA